MLALWRRWRERRGSGMQSRMIYLVMTLGFGALALAAAIAGDAAVAALAGVATAVTLALALFASQIARWVSPPGDGS